MLKHTRVTGIPDVIRMGAATARPGNDPRTWCSYATVQAVGIDSEGLFADVILQPTGESMTARVGMPYSGPNIALHFPIGVGDEVLVGVPNGDPGHGAAVLARMSSPSDPLPQAVLDHPDDVVLVVQEGKAIRLVVNGPGAELDLGAEQPFDQVPRGTTYRTAEDARFAAMDAAIAALAANVAALFAAVPTLTGSPAQKTAYNASVTAVADAATALVDEILTFDGASPSYLSNTVKVAP